MRVLTTVIAHPNSLAGSPPAWLCVYIRRTGILSLLSALKKTRPPSRYTHVDSTAIRRGATATWYAPGPRL